MAQIDVIVRISAAALLLLLSLLLAKDRRGWESARLFAPLALGLIGFIAGNTAYPALRLAGSAGEIAHWLSGYAAPFIWWFCLSCFDRRQPVRGFPLIAGLCWIAIASIDRGLLGPRLAEAGLSSLLLIFGFVMVAHMAWRLMRDRVGDLIERRRDARVVVILLLGGLLLVDLLADVVMGFDWRPEAFALFQNGCILGFCLWLSYRLLDADVGILRFEAPAGGAEAPIPADLVGESPLGRRIEALMTVERVYLDPDIDFARFVRRADAPERAVRAQIRMLGHDHFRAFLNHHRLIEARRLLADPAHADHKLIAIAFDSGFTSLATFNRIFLMHEGRSPSAFRDACRTRF